MLELEQAVTRILAAVPPPTEETVPISESFGRFLAQSVCAGVDLPPFDNSSVDGFAVSSRSTGMAAAHRPLRLRIFGKVAAGEVFQGELPLGGCLRVFTGSPLPAGADAVVMQEDARPDPDDPDMISIAVPAQPGENVRRRGEDVRNDSVIAQPGELLTASRVNLLAATGAGAVKVGRRPLVGLMATGTELREPGQPLGPGQIYESNRLGLAALVREAGGIPFHLPLVPDALTATRLALLQAFEDCDIVVTSGGVSVGELDFIKRAFNQAGGELEFWRVAIKPGRPFVFGRRGARLLFGLPGNPVAAFVTFLVLARPAGANTLY